MSSGRREPERCDAIQRRVHGRDRRRVHHRARLRHRRRRCPARTGRARKAALQANYLSVRQSGGEQLLFGRGVTVLKRRGRVVIWEDGHQSFTSPAGRRCFERDTEFDRGAASEVRRGAAPPDVRGARFIDRHGSRVLRARERHTDFADTEFELRVDKSGRPRSMRSRSARFGVLPPRRWLHMRYEFLTAAEFHRRAGDPPTPRCR